MSFVLLMTGQQIYNTDKYVTWEFYWRDISGYKAETCYILPLDIE